MVKRSPSSDATTFPQVRPASISASASFAPGTPRSGPWSGTEHASPSARAREAAATRSSDVEGDERRGRDQIGCEGECWRPASDWESVKKATGSEERGVARDACDDGEDVVVGNLGAKEGPRDAECDAGNGERGCVWTTCGEGDAEKVSVEEDGDACSDRADLEDDTAGRGREASDGDALCARSSAARTMEWRSGDGTLASGSNAPGSRDRGGGALIAAARERARTTTPSAPSAEGMR